MHPVLAFAFGRHAGADQFGQAVDVVRADAQLAFNFTAHVLAPGFGTETARLEWQGGKINAFLLCGFREKQGVGRRARQQGGAKVAHDVQLTAGVACRNRDHVRANAAHAVMHAKTTGKQAIAKGILYGIALFTTGHRQGAGHDVRPQINIPFRIGTDHRRTGSAGGGMNFNQIRTVARQQAVGIGVAQFVFAGEGKSGTVFQAADGIGRHPQFIHLATIKRHPGIHPFHRFLQTLQLCLLTRLQRGAFSFLVPDWHVISVFC